MLKYLVDKNIEFEVIGGMFNEDRLNAYPTKTEDWKTSIHGRKPYFTAFSKMAMFDDEIVKTYYCHESN